MPEGPPPLELLRRLEEICEGEPCDQIIFCLGIIMGRLIMHSVQPEYYQEVIVACVDAIQAGINGIPTEH